MVRSAQWEEEWRAHLARRVHALYDVVVERLNTMVVHRLALGKERYGDDDFLDKDVIAEALEEAADCVVYAMLESQKRLADGRSDGLDDLQHAAEHAAMADHYFRRAGRSHLNAA
jgi:hypothetical protein